MLYPLLFQRLLLVHHTFRTTALGTSVLEAEYTSGDTPSALTINTLQNNVCSPVPRSPHN